LKLPQNQEKNREILVKIEALVRAKTPEWLLLGFERFLATKKQEN
jgi:hypothetical protein